MRTAAACAPLVLAVLFAAVPVGAVDRVARSSNVVVRERPGSDNPGVAILKRGDRVRFFGERDGWTEVGLPDGRSGWVLSAEIAPVVEPPPPNVPEERSAETMATARPAPSRTATTLPSVTAPTPTAKPRATETANLPAVVAPASPTAKPRATETAPASLATPSPAARTPGVTVPRTEGDGSSVEQARTLARLETEIVELRRSVDRLAAHPARTAPDSAGAPWTRSESLIAGAVAFVIGLIVGSVVQRRRARRERTLRF